MTNKNYIKGRNKEYRLINELRKRGFDIVQRTAGSHSPIDIIAIHKYKEEILFIQSKPDNFSEKEESKLNNKYNYLNGLYKCSFIIR
jgi:Holliday junction resolvase